MIIIISLCNTWRCPQRFSETIGSSDLGVWHDDRSMYLVARKDCLHWDFFRYILRGLNSYRVYHRILWGFFFFMKLFLVRLLWNFIGIVFGMCTCAFRVWHFQNDRRCHDNHESSKDFFYPIVMKLHRNDPGNVWKFIQGLNISEWPLLPWQLRKCKHVWILNFKTLNINSAMDSH
jgi:hypothetical protein